MYAEIQRRSSAAIASTMRRIRSGEAQQSAHDRVAPAERRQGVVRPRAAGRERARQHGVQVRRQESQLAISEEALQQHEAVTLEQGRRPRGLVKRLAQEPHSIVGLAAVRPAWPWQRYSARTSPTLSRSFQTSLRRQLHMGREASAPRGWQHGPRITGGIRLPAWETRGSARGRLRTARQAARPFPRAKPLRS